MQIKDIIEQYKTRYQPEKFQKSERAEIVKKFVDVLNDDRIKSGRKSLSASFYAIKMAEAKLSTQDLYWFFAYCQESKNFSSCWWWSLKSNK